MPKIEVEVNDLVSYGELGNKLLKILEEQGFVPSCENPNKSVWEGKTPLEDIFALAGTTRDQLCDMGIYIDEIPQD